MGYTAATPDDKAVKERKDNTAIRHHRRRLHDEPSFPYQGSADMLYDPQKIAKPEQLTKGDQFTAGAFSWSPDGTESRSTLAAIRSGLPDTQRIYILDLASLNVRKLVDTPGPNTIRSGRLTANRSPTSPPMAIRFLLCQPLHRHCPADGGSPILLTKEFDEDPNLTDWAPDGIYFSANQKPPPISTALTATHAVRRITGRMPSTPPMPRSRRSPHMAGVGASPNHFAEVFASSTSDLRRIPQ